MLCSLRHRVLGAAAPRIILPRDSQVRMFWEYVNMSFNRPDVDRIKQFGPDRTCAEWVLRNGGRVVWDGGRKLADYNMLPPEKQAVPKLIEIDGTDSSISHYGFPHLIGCTKLSKVILHNASYIDDRALKGLSYGRDTITYLQVSKCLNVTDAGLKELKTLHKLETLLLFQLESVVNLEGCKLILQQHLPKCKVLGSKDGVDVNDNKQ
ncbi:hypothetical protein PYW08_003255 [Mythimna loreyi]|uniref:Uncharacterized protein n=1 Tax=Mythimna loreyi TaxID=667449 RepID=A0ACC2QVT3_9NEOP|nr:hypothetical protein PYW08_003255 [Mythimna loreyi]